VVIPKSRGWLARLGNLFPKLALRGNTTLERRGLDHLQQLRDDKKT